jgi:hypothetical protein
MAVEVSVLSALAIPLQMSCQCRSTSTSYWWRWRKNVPVNGDAKITDVTRQRIEVDRLKLSSAPT